MSLYKPTSYSDAIGVLYGRYSEQTKPRILWSISLNCWAVTYNYDRDGLPLGAVKRFDDWISAAEYAIRTKTLRILEHLNKASEDYSD